MNQVKIRNALHEKALADCTAFVKAGGKIKRSALVKRKLEKHTINKKTGEK